MGLKEAIKKQEQKIANMEKDSTVNKGIKQEKYKLKKMYNKRDRIFARYKAKRENKMLIRDYPVDDHNVYYLKDAISKNKKKLQKKNKTDNQYVEENRDNKNDK